MAKRNDSWAWKLLAGFLFFFFIMMSIQEGNVELTVFLVLLVVFFFVYTNNSPKKNNKSLELQQNYLKLCLEELLKGKFAFCDELILKKNEKCLWATPTALWETRAVRHSSGSGGRVRIMKGVSIGSGSGTSHSEQVLREIDKGSIVVTNQRVVFVGNEESRDIPIKKIISAKPNEDNDLVVNSSSRKKSMVFSSAGLACDLIRIALHEDDIENISEETKKIIKDTIKKLNNEQVNNEE